MADQYLVRLRPYNKRRGNVCRQYVLKGKVFKESKGWYLLPAGNLVEYLRSLCVDSSDPESAKMFDVMNKTEAEATDKREKLAARERAEANSPNAVENARAGRGTASEPIKARKPAAKPAPAKKDEPKAEVDDDTFDLD